MKKTKKIPEKIGVFKVLRGVDADTVDIKTIDDRPYRRGYHHGYEQALSDIKYGKNTSKFTKYNGELMKWRFGKENYPCNETIIPPSATKMRVY